MKKGQLISKIKGLPITEQFTILGKPIIVKTKSWTPVLFDDEKDPCFVKTHKIKPLNTPKKLIKPKRLTKTQKLLIKAKKLYPIGTKFTSIFGANDVVTKSPFDNMEIYYIDSSGDCIMVHGKNQTRMIFDGKYWADIYK